MSPKHLPISATVRKGLIKWCIPSKSLKLLPILGLPSLPSLPFPFIPGLLPASSAVRFGLSGPVGLCLCLSNPCKACGRFVAGVELALESLVADCSAASMLFLCTGTLRPIFLGSPRSVADGSWCVVPVSVGEAKGMNAGSSSSSSASSDCPSLLENRGGRRRRRLCRGGDSSDDESEELADGEERGSGRGERVGGSIAIEAGRDFGFGERERRFRTACAGRGLVCGAKLRDVMVVFADDVRENGGADGVSAGNLLSYE